ncbi:MAG TPA: gamma-glutamyltransferase family protein [Ginsengibacter sp.]
MKSQKCINWDIIFFIFLLLAVGSTRGYSQKRVSVSSLPYDSLHHLVTKHAMVSSEHLLSSEIGKEIMEKGGNAVDAAVATAFAVSVSAPALSGLGGGGCMLIWLKDQKKVIYIDFYAAKRVSAYKSIGSNKEGHKLWEVGIPGEVAGLLYAEDKYGKLSREEVMGPAIKLARDGFPMYPFFAHLIESGRDNLEQYDGKNLLFPNEETFPIGKIFKQEKLAETLQMVADKGASVFYNGSVGKDIVKVLNEGGIPVTMKDFQDYRIDTDKAPLTTTYKKWKVFTPPPPQGGLEIIEDLNILDSFNMKETGLPTQSAHAFHILTGAMRAGIADRVYNVDPNWARIPSEILTSKEYARERTKYALQTPTPYSIKPGQLDLNVSSNKLKVNNKDVSLKEVKVDDGKKDGRGYTTSLSVVDADGNAVALTQTLSWIFGGNGVWVDGFFLNNSGVDFSQPIPDPYTLPEPTGDYRRPGSTIAPTIILNKDNTVKLVIGSPGGNLIPTRIVQNIVYILDYGMDPIVAARMPRIYPLSATNGVHTEEGFNGKVYEKERENGYDFYINFGSHAEIYSIVRRDGYWIGAADPLVEGGVAGY